MMWSLHVLFQINCIVTKRRERLRASGVVSLFHLFFLMDQTHSLSTASHRGFQHDRKTDLPADPACFFAPAGKIRILGQETISGMNRIHLVLLGCSDDLFDIQVTIF